MARITATIPVKSLWDPTDRLVLLVGSENVGTLSASTPSGGREVASVAVGERADEAEPDPIVLAAEVAVIDKCAMLPIGVAVEDIYGNRSGVLESFERVADIPRGARDHSIEATENTGEALLTFTPSADL